MSTKYRVGIIGFGHMHINHVAEVFSAHPSVQWVACADTVPRVPELRTAPYTRAWNRQNVMTRFGIPTYYANYREMLTRESLDIVIVTTENDLHPAVVEACAAAGVPWCCLEKPMAASLPDALRMVRAVEAAGTNFIVNWPATWQASNRKAKMLIEGGVIGRVLEVKLRLGHSGPLGPSASHAGVSEGAGLLSGPERAATWWHQSAAGGGAMLDFCGYGCMIARWYVGEPAVAAVGIKANLDSQYGDAEDNAAVILRFPGAMALCEGTFTTWDHGVSGGPVVYGTRGTLVVERRAGVDVVRLERGGGNTTIYEAEPLPHGRHAVSFELIYHLETGDPLHETLGRALNLDAMAALDAGVRSAASGRIELVNNRAWCIG